MSIFGRRILEIGVISILLVLVVSVSCAMGRACPSGFISSSGSNKLGSGGGSGNNMIGTDEKIKDIHQKVTQAKGNNNSDTLNTVTPTSTEGDMSTTNKPISVILYSANNHYGREAELTFTKRECQNLPELMQNRVNSINTHGECVILCDNLDCDGWCIKFAPTTPAHHRFRKLRFHNRAESAISCE